MVLLQKIAKKLATIVTVKDLSESSTTGWCPSHKIMMQSSLCLTHTRMILWRVLPSWDIDENLFYGSHFFKNPRWRPCKTRRKRKHCFSDCVHYQVSKNV